MTSVGKQTGVKIEFMAKDIFPQLSEAGEGSRDAPPQIDSVKGDEMLF